MAFIPSNYNCPFSKPSSQYKLKKSIFKQDLPILQQSLLKKPLYRIINIPIHCRKVSELSYKNPIVYKRIPHHNISLPPKISSNQRSATKKIIPNPSETIKISIAKPSSQSRISNTQYMLPKSPKSIKIAINLSTSTKTPREADESLSPWC
jgi:hypothetical protein